MIRGQCIVLTEIDPASAEVVRGWLNDPGVHEWMPTGHVPISAAAEREWYERAERESAAGREYSFEVHAAARHDPRGVRRAPRVKLRAPNPFTRL